MPLLFNHNMDDVLGTVEHIEVGSDRRGYATVRFGSDARGDWAMHQVQTGILKNTSFLYRVYKARPDPNDDETSIVSDYEPYELSLVSVGADASVGVGRSLNFGESNMTDEVLTRSQRRAAAADSEAAREATEAERDRIAEISAMGSRFNVPAAVQTRAIDNGTPVADFRRSLSTELRRDDVQPVATAGSWPGVEQRDMTARGLGLTARELGRYSLFRALRAISLTDVAAKRDAGFELEVSAALAARSPTEARGLCVPLEIAGGLRQRAPVLATGAGASLVENQLLAADFINPQYVQPRVLQLGATVLSGLVGNILIPKMSSPDQVAWLGTEGAGYTNTSPTLAQVSMSPHDIAAYVDLSRRLLMQATPAAESLIRSDLSKVVSIAIDNAAISGAGTSGVPLGILNQSGIGTVAAGTNGGSVTYAICGALVGELAAANALYGNLAWITTGGLAAHMMATAKFQYGSATLWEPPVREEPAPGEGSIMYMPSMISNNVPSNGTKGTGTNLQSLILANWGDLLVGQWGVLQILADPFSQSTTGTVRLTAIQTVDIQVRHPASFAVCTDLTLT